MDDITGIAYKDGTIKVSDDVVEVGESPETKYIIDCWGGAFNDGPVNGIEQGRYASKDKSAIDKIEKELMDHSNGLMMISRYDTKFFSNKGIKYIVKIGFKDKSEDETICIDYHLPQDYNVKDIIYKAGSIDILQYIPKLREASYVKVEKVYIYGYFDVTDEVIQDSDTFDNNYIQEYLNN